MNLIAIIGMSCRFPGGSNDPDSFWDLLVQRKGWRIEVPEGRWDSHAYYDPNPEVPGKMYTQLGGFLNISVDHFDAAFFGISPREAEYMDPQQRLSEKVLVGSFRTCMHKSFVFERFSNRCVCRRWHIRLRVAIV